MNYLKVAIFVLLSQQVLAQGDIELQKKEAIDWIDRNQRMLTSLSDSIWWYAEPSFWEYQSTALLIAQLATLPEGLNSPRRFFSKKSVYFCLVIFMYEYSIIFVMIL